MSFPRESTVLKTGPLTTPDGRYIVVDGQLWRRSNPTLGQKQRALLVEALMHARRDVGQALRAHDAEAEAEARARVHRAKVALGERGPPWWTDGTPDFNRRRVEHTPYAEWFRAQRGR
ncbi:MAG TPA: hypothetical protein VFZ09_19115 [Archangium sp.]|uniref:hypothetical protein n=1 Tax=Archangium sp. TaxID=1872627 RepID=UPI002E353777|nr:hypothetical protein [Archangium sp.]HEX5748359.1 hypothetical protein [Archangium sp.]